MEAVADIYTQEERERLAAKEYKRLAEHFTQREAVIGAKGGRGQ